MTYKQYSRLLPGDAIRDKKTKQIRVVVSRPGDTQRSKGRGPIGLVKVGHSWTDPNPTAWYDAWVIVSRFAVTGRQGLSRERAEDLRNWSRKPKGRVFRFVRRRAR